MKSKSPKKKSSAKRALDLTSSTNAGVLMDSIKESVQLATGSPAKTNPKTASSVPLASAGTVRLGRVFRINFEGKGNFLYGGFQSYASGL